MKLEDLRILAQDSILFSLEKIITPKIIKVFYLLGLTAIALFAISHLFATFSFGFGAGLWGLLEIAVFGLLSFIILRISCEMIIVFFESHETIVNEKAQASPSKSLIDDVNEAIEELADDEKQKNQTEVVISDKMQTQTELPKTKDPEKQSRKPAIKTKASK